MMYTRQLLFLIGSCMWRLCSENWEDILLPEPMKAIHDKKESRLRLWNNIERKNNRQNLGNEKTH